MTPSTPLPKKRAAKASVIDRLLAVKRARLVPRTVEDAAAGTLLVGGRRLENLDNDLALVQKHIGLVGDIRERLADVTALPQKGTLL